MKIEKFEDKRREIPTGKGGEVSKAMQEYLVLFEKVKNKVAFVNPGFSDPEKKLNLPFKLEKGKESPLGLFVKATFAEGYTLKKDEQLLESWPVHRRSALLGRVIFSDKEGRFYRDLDIKGSGYVVEGKVGVPGEPIGEDEYSGLLGDETAHDECKTQEEFLKEGIRTVRTLAIINLEEIIFEGKKLPVEEAWEKGMIEKMGGQPVIAVRAFGTKARILNITLATTKKEVRELILDDAKNLVSQETGKDLSNNQDYLQWFTETLGENVGIMNKNGWFHRNLAPPAHNITLDCRIVDLDEVIKINKRGVIWENYRRKDIENASHSLSRLAYELGFSDRIEKFRNHFLKSYNAVFPETDRAKLLREIEL